MIFVDFLGPSTLFSRLQSLIAEEVGAVLRARTSNVVVRRILTDPEPEEIEVWIELSSDEQLFRYGRALAQRIADRLHSETQANVWVMFRIVPLSQAFLNGQPRARGNATFD